VQKDDAPDEIVDYVLAQQITLPRMVENEECDSRPIFDLGIKM
jgi:hypothetical protein